MRKFLSLAAVFSVTGAFFVMNATGAAVPQKKTGIAGTYSGQCAKCHGEDGKGIQSLQPPDFTSADWQKSRTDKQIADTIKNGAGIMPGYKTSLSAAQVTQMVKYVRSFGPKAGKK